MTLIVSSIKSYPLPSYLWDSGDSSDSSDRNDSFDGKKMFLKVTEEKNMITIFNKQEIVIKKVKLKLRQKSKIKFGQHYKTKDVKSS